MTTSRFFDGLLVGAGAIAVGFLAWRACDVHSHVCDSCGHAWTHAGAFHFGDDRAHACAKCGRMQWWRVGAPRHLHHGAAASGV
jgi:hypothetical protein